MALAPQTAASTLFQSDFLGQFEMETLPSELVLWQNRGKAVAPKDENRNAYFPGNSSFLAQFDPNERPSYDTMQLSLFPTTSSWNGPCMMPILSVPNVEEGSSKANIILMGTAKEGGTGPSVGAVDIGTSKTAYYFRVSLPGVKKDPGQFSCEIEHDGKVHVRGVTTTGENFVSRHTRVFQMKVQQQCPPGPFTLSFSLPGPVDPRMFFPNFRSDGILEAVALKYE
ncbi:Increased DNA methylation like [Heracleum sosnowskyi]|uniref:Increased DNA methylation like n=1 Tax=Heracleum sosnowskyi TaxID=360622 RepID=A0AAD8JAG4_9APIA|nr:Increased DNA methylation like [Heracleum sosnowskyi]